MQKATSSNVNDDVHLVTEENLASIYGQQSSGHVTIGRLANAESIPVKIDLEKLLTRHSAILGSTGSGKSTTVSSLLRSISAQDASGFPSARIMVLDIHGEYASALKDVAKVFRVSPEVGEEKLAIPFWALPPSEVLNRLVANLLQHLPVRVRSATIRRSRPFSSSRCRSFLTSDGISRRRAASIDKT